MEIIIGLIILALLVTAVVAIAAYNNSRTRVSIRSSVNPEVICRSRSCVVNVSWEVESSRGEVDVRVLIQKPNQDVVQLSNNETGTLQLDSQDASIFDQTGVYFLEINAESSDTVRSESRRIAFHGDAEFFLNDTWNTGFTGGSLSPDETTATRSLILSQNPFLGEITEIDSKLPTTITVCSKSMALRKIQYVSGTIRSDGAGVRNIDIVVRRPGGAEIISQTLKLDEELVLPQEAIVDNGIEILSTMKSEIEPPRSIAGSSWTLRLTVGCVG